MVGGLRLKGSQKEIRSGRRGDFTLPTLLSTCRQQPLAALIAVALIAPLAFSAPALAIEANNVLVIYNADDGNQSDGYQIAQHYQQARPGVHLAPLTGINDILGGTYGEDVSGDDYLSVIRHHVVAAINHVPDTIDVIVTTKRLPLRIDAGPR